MDNQTPATGGEFMLFGVRVVVDSMRKSVSLNNLSQYEHRLDSSSSNDQKEKEKDVIAAGYASADEAIPHSSSTAAATTTGSGVSRERKRGVPWTEEEHKLFLIGLQKVGKGDWRGISRNFVKTRTPTQVASHAQKYFLRRSNLNRRRRRSSLFDITTDSVAGNSSSEEQAVKENNNNVATSQSPPPPPQQPPQQQITEISNVRSYQQKNHHHPIYPVVSFSQAPQAPDHQRKSMADFDLNENSLSLNLSLSMSPADLTNSSTASSSRHSGFQLMQGFGNGDSIISVA